MFVFKQKARVIDKITAKSGTLFHPDVNNAFLEAAASDIFWIDIDNLSIEQLFNKLDFTLDMDLTYEIALEFALTLSRIVDFRSRFTVSHSYTVAQLAELIGGYFGYSQEERNKLKIAGYLHDIGKIGINPGLLEKNGPLTEEEFQMVKLHPYFTEQILSELHKSKWLDDVITWASQHHEKSNGTGYPHGLKDNEITEGSKIIALADVITALIEDRPYRAGMSVEDAFSIIKEEIAPQISSEMFNEIERHQNEIGLLISTCKQYSSEEYLKGIIQFNRAT